LLENDNSIALATRTGRPIPNAQDPDLPPHRVTLLVEQFRKRFPTAQLRIPPTGRYNCHGLTFANRRTQVGVFDTRVIGLILEDDGFRNCGRESLPQSGDILVCYDGVEVSHTRIVMFVEPGKPEQGVFPQIFVLSKWGPAGEYFHIVNTGPYSSHRVTYWTDRP
jgi:hypothetical protein